MALSYTDGLGNSWYFDSYGNLQDARGTYISGGYSYTHDTLDSTSLSLYVGGSTNTTGLTWGSSVVSGNTQSVTGTNTTAGISVTRKTYVADGYVRMLEIVTNTGTAATSVKVNLDDDIYYDSSTQTIATSSGDTTRTTSDDWSAYGNSSYTSYPKLTHVVSGGAGSPSGVSSTYADHPVTSYNLNLAAGETKVIMHFYALSSDTAGATSIGNSLANLSSNTYLSGMTASELSALTNFTKDFSVSSTTTLPSYGLNLTLTGSSAINGTGNARDNLITGNAAANQLSGLAGNDTLNGGGGNDTMAGGAGNDTFYVNTSGDVVNENANEGIDTVFSSISYNISAKPYIENITLTGTTSGLAATGNHVANVLDGSLHSGANTLTGGLGNDTYIVGTGDVIVEAASAGTDTVKAGVSMTLAANLENLELTGTGNVNGSGNSAANRITGNAGKNALTGAGGNDTLNGGTGADTMTGGDGSDVYYVDNVGDVVTESNATASTGGVDTVYASINHTLSSNVENLVLQGSTYKGIGNELANKLTGNAADNFLDGKAGADTMAGGTGNDTYVVGSGDVVTEALNAGIDTVRTALSSHSLGANIENGVMLTGATIMNGNDLANRIDGNSANNTVSGGLGNDILNGLGGNDSISGGDGDDLLVGDNGGPETIVSSAETIVNNQVVALNLSAPELATGTAKVTGSISGVSLGQTGVNIVYVVDHSGSMTSGFLGATNVGDTNGDGSTNTVLDAAIASVQKLNQSIIQSGLGNQVNVTLVQFDDTAEILYTGAPGNDGNGNGIVDVIDQLQTFRADGGTGYNAAMTTVKDHLMSLGSGKNIVFFMSDGDPTDGTTYQTTAAQVRALGQDGTLIRAIGMGSGANENPLDLLDDGVDNNSAIIAMNPEDLDATLLNTSVLQLAEGAWVEIYRNNVMVDLIGPDRFTISPLGVRFESNAITLGTSGTDQITAKLMTMSTTGAMIQTSVPITIGSFVSNDTLVGGAGNDTLDGGVGADSMLGGTGNDTYVVDNASDQVIENVGEGTDTVRSKLASYTLSTNVENLQLIGAAINGTGNDLANTITGNELNNSLSGGARNDTIYGGLGNDSLNGGAGNDSMVGGDGNDSYYVDSTYDTVNETSAGGIDTVIASFNASLGGYISGVSSSKTFYEIENLTLLAGSSAVNAIGSTSNNILIGNALDNKLYGLAGNDTLNGSTGLDTMDGGDGNDTYYVENIGDVIIDASGTDTVVAYLNNYTLGTGLENLTLANRSAVLNGTGNSAANVIKGNSYNNVLNGGTSADTMTGGAGNDTYYVDNANDRVIEISSEGTDTVRSSVSHMLTSNVENLTLSGSNAIGGAGNSLGNKITGNAGANRLLGWAGNDTLSGAAGNDTIDGGTGNDVIYGGTGGDVITGGSGNDQFVFDSELGSTNLDTLTDFSVADDTILLDEDIFTALGVVGTSTGAALTASTFQLGTAANDAEDRIIYDQASGKLYYDADGTGASVKVQIALIGTTTHAALAATDFLVVA